jgi:AraC family transcriptional regulator
MAELTHPQDLQRWVPGKLLLASDALDWPDVLVRSYAYEPSDVEVPPLRDFALVAYCRGPTSMDRCLNEHWTRDFLVPGNVSLLTRAEPSHWRWTSRIEVAHVYLTAGILARVCAEVFDRDIADLRLQDVLKADDSGLRASVAAIADEARTLNLGGRLFVDAAASQLCVHILRRYATVTFRERSATAGLSPLQAKLVSRYIGSNLEQQLTLHDLAQVAHLSATHFLRQFKLRFGCAPHQYVIQRRLADAQRLLAKTRLPIKEIAARSGFSDQSHMTRLFQQYLHATPQAFRKSVRS